MTHLPMLTTWLIRRRDTAADAWLRECTTTHAQGATTTAERRTRRRLAAWDYLLTLWTSNGTRRP